MRGRRAWVALAATVLLVGIAGAAWFSTRPGTLVEVEVFDPPSSFCASATDGSYADMLDGIVATPGEDFRTQKAQVWAGLLRPTARLDDTPAPAATELRTLARAVEELGTSDNRSAIATEAARSLDRRVAATCR